MLQKLKVPPSFSIVKKGDITLLVKERYKELILPIVFDKKSLHHKDRTNVKCGRGSYLSVPVAENSEERLIIRNYRHGGLLGRLFGGVFYDGNRPLNEIYANEVAFQKGVPSAEVIAVTKKKLWGLFYKADFISKEISGAVDIAQFLKESSSTSIRKSKKSIIFALVKLIRNMHDAGIYHADLHLKNILLKKDSDTGFRAYIIDLDKSAVFNRLTLGQRMKNLLRLDRSIEKLRWLSEGTNISQKDMKNHANGKDTTPLSPILQRGDGGVENLSSDKKYQSNVSVSQGGEPSASLRQKIDLISQTDRVRFLKSYMLYDNALDKNWKRYIRQYHSHHFLHKLWWRVVGLS